MTIAHCSEFIDTQADCGECGQTGACTICLRCADCGLPEDGFCRGCGRKRPRNGQREWGDTVYVIDEGRIFRHTVVQEAQGLTWTEIPGSGGQVLTCARSRVFDTEAEAQQAMERWRTRPQGRDGSRWQGQHDPDLPTP